MGRTLFSGQESIVTANISLATPTVPAVTSSNDGSLSCTQTATGRYAVAFGHAFLSAPVVSVVPYYATFASATTFGVQVSATATNSVTVDFSVSTATNTLPVLTDPTAFHIIAIGKRWK